MSLPVYQVIVLDPVTGSVRYLFDVSSFYELRYSRALNDVGVIAMTMPSASDIRAVFTLDSFIEVYREDETGSLVFEETYLTRLTHRFVEGEVEKFVVGGLSLNHFLMRRVIDPDDDPSQAGGFSTKAGRADRVIYEYINEQIGPSASASRRLPGLVLTSLSHVGGGVGARLRHENLFKKVQEYAKQGAVDFTTRRTTGANFELTIGVVGSDKTRTTNEPLGKPWVGLTPLRGNLTLPSLARDRKEEANYIYALGQGQRDKRIVYKAAGTGTVDSPFNRCEFAEDVRNVQKSDVLGLITGAEVALKEKLVKREFSYQPTNQEPGNVYHVDWNLGDAVTTVWDEDEFDLRITNVEVAVSAQGETISATVTDDFQFPGSVDFFGATPTRDTTWRWADDVLVGAALTSPNVNVNQIYNHNAYQTPAALNDEFTSSVWLRSGAYTLYIRALTDFNFGIVTWYLDGVAVGSNDWYSGSLTYNVLKTLAVNVTTTGKHVLKGKVLSKNASSISYFFVSTKCWFSQASD